jgi:hypothetical protein
MRKLPVNYVFTLRPAGNRKGRKGRLVQRRLGSNRHHPVAWRGGTTTK